MFHRVMPGFPQGIKFDIHSLDIQVSLVKLCTGFCQGCKVHFVVTDFKAERALIGKPVHPSYFTHDDTRSKEQVCSLIESCTS